MKILGRVYRYLFWSNLYRVCPIWDAIVRDRMGKNDIKILSKYEAKLGDLRLHIGNHPYASFMNRDARFGDRYLPKKETRHKLNKLVYEKLTEYIKNSYPI